LGFQPNFHRLPQPLTVTFCFNIEGSAMIYATLSAVLVIASGVIVFQSAVLFTLKSNDPWIKSLPALVPFIAFVAILFLSLGKDAWQIELGRMAAEFLQRHTTITALATAFAMCCAGLLSRYNWTLAHAKEGRFVVHVVRQNDVPEDYIANVPVIIEHKLRFEPPIEKPTAANGRAEFEVDHTDVFTVRLLRSPDKGADVFVVKSNTSVSEKNNTAVELVRLADIPNDAWIKSRTSAATAATPGAEEIFARLPPKYFQWRTGIPSVHTVADPPDFKPTFPFPLPPAETLILRREFAIGFSPVLRLPRWVAYAIVPGDPIQRSADVFLADPLLPAAYQAASRDFVDNDFDRGHLVRRADLFGLGEESVRKIFYLSAVVPQLAYVNRKTWLALESQTFQLAKADDAKVHVLRGPVFAASPGRDLVEVSLIGPNQIPVPTHFFQIARTERQGQIEVTAHLVPNRYVALGDDGLNVFKSSVADIARLSGLPLDTLLEH
jgi:DNA/RNA endonuclease G (NUC1)